MSGVWLNCKKVRSNFNVLIPWQKSVVQQKNTENTQFWNLKLLSNANCISVFRTNKYFFSVSFWDGGFFSVFYSSAQVFWWKRMGTLNTSLVQMILTTFYLASTNFQAVFALLHKFAIYGRSKKLSSGKEGVCKVR